MLPEDFRKHWIQNFIYETYFYGRLVKLYNTSPVDGTYIDLYKYTTHRGKHIKVYYVKYEAYTSLSRRQASPHNTVYRPYCGLIP